MRLAVSPSRLLAAVAAAALVATSVATGTGPAAGEPGDPGRPGTPPAGAGLGDDVRSITLVTGDRVDVREETGGRRSFEFVPAAGRGDVTVHEVRVDGESYLYPVDAIPLVAADRVDRELFNVDRLLAQGYDDAALDTVPLIATTSGGPAGARALTTLTGAETGADLSSIDARAIDVAKTGATDFWAGLTRGRARLAVGVEKVWLDQRVTADLDRSVPQIGAPTAWEAGFDGTGVTVGVLDTGVDADHPDLAGQVVDEENFSSSDSVEDRFGHGTHVAATVAGTGEGSQPARPGVAPGADVLSGKVLGDDGTGWTSDIIEAMEWAAEADADVVNMSLGGGPTDGTDPLSVAVNELSESTGTLFVVSAGNDGPGASTIGSPGSADGALTVGAVDRDESLADFSSRGPRLGDLAIKPDLTAPGVDIVAARASGTSMGTPVDDLYTTASGTSMAAPHVAGAAAVLAQQHPDWTGAQLKDALISTALPGDLTEHEQGGGRVDVERAVTQPVHGTGTVDLGTRSVEDVEVVTEQVTWTNTGEEDVVLSLALDVADLGGDVPGEGALTIPQDEVTVPAGGTASVDLVLDPARADKGIYSGQLVAQSGDTVVHTTVGFSIQPPVHEVTIRPVGLDGEIESATPVVLMGEDPRFDTVVDVWGGNPLTVELGEGSYYLSANMGLKVDDETAIFSITDPDLEITGDRTLVLDARDAVRVEIDTPKPAELTHDLGYTVRRQARGRSVSHSVQQFATTRSMWVTPTDPADGGEYEFTSRWQLTEPLLTARSTGGGARLALTPHYERMSPVIEGRRQWEVVRAGAGTPEDYEGVDVEGKIALVTLTEKGSEDAEAAVEAGAAMLLIAPADGTYWPTKFTGRGTRLPLPVAALTPHEADLVNGRLDRGALTLRLDGKAHSSYLYDVLQVSQDRVPRRVLHRVTPGNSATITASYHEMGGEPWAKEQRNAWRPWQQTTIVEKQRELPTPLRRTEMVSSGVDDTLWRQHVLSFFSFDSMNPILGGAVHPLRAYRHGSRLSYDWFRSVVRPDVPTGSSATRTGDVLDLPIAELAGNGGATYDRATDAESTTLLHENGRLIASGDRAWGSYPVQRRKAEYTLDLGVERSSATWEYSTRTDTTWTFQSTRPATGTAPLPLLQVDYDVPVGLDNRVEAGRRHTLGLTVAPGTSDSGRVRTVRGWISFDDGDTWQPLRLTRGPGHRWQAAVRHPDDAAFATLRVEAADDAGNAVEQTVRRAYGLRPRA